MMKAIHRLVVKAIAISDVVSFAHVDSIVVPDITGLPGGKLYVPAPFLGMINPQLLNSPAAMPPYTLGISLSGVGL